MYRLTITNKDKTEIDEDVGGSLVAALRTAGAVVEQLEEASEDMELDIVIGVDERKRVIGKRKGAPDGCVVRILGDDDRVYYEYAIKGNKGGETW